MNDRLKLLTDKQRECLRLVWQQHDSKQIARILGLKPDAVDGRIKTASKVLGVSSRFDAARLLAAADAAAEGRSGIYPPSDVPEPSMPAPSFLSSQPAERRSDHLAFEEAQASYRLSPQPSGEWLVPPLPGDGRETNALSIKERLLWIGAIAAVTGLAFGAFADGMKAISSHV